MRAIIHCPFCHSRTDMLTDGNGHLVERLNHRCRCAARKAAAVATEDLPRSCLDCGTPIRRMALRCARCAKRHNRAKQDEWHRTNREREATRAR